MSFKLGRLVCAIIPYGQSEDVIKTHQDTNSIIGYDQYRRLKRILPPVQVELLNSSTQYGDSDVLVIMSTIWTVPFEILKKFRKIVYFYDDIEVWKAQTDKYRAHMKYVDVLLHPEPDVAKSLSDFWDIPTFYIPWSSASVPSHPRPTTLLTPKIFIDIDKRSFTAKSVEYAGLLISDLESRDVEIYVPKTAIELLPGSLKARVIEVPGMSHERFLQFMSGMTWYASVISGSYEYVVMESALLGCGLISLFNAFRRFHRNRACVLDYKGNKTIWSDICAARQESQIVSISATAKALYPFDAVLAIPDLLGNAFSF
jgi:hypothetical protein